jgi:hypothetical protein
MKKAKNIAMLFDIFSPHFEFEVNKNDTRFSTVAGGVYSIILFIVVLIYGSMRLE